MPEKESAEKRKERQRELGDHIKAIPPPPPEHVAELKMERKLKRIIQRKEKGKKRNSVRHVTSRENSQL